MRKKPVENIARKGENAGNQNFLLFPPCFLAFAKKIEFLSHIYVIICKCFQFGPVHILVVW